MMKNELKPCKADADYNSGQLAIGQKVEMEHTDLPNVAKTIAKHHLDEYPDYYKMLEHAEMFLEEGNMSLTAHTDDGKKVTVLFTQCKFRPDGDLDCTELDLFEEKR